MLQISTNPELFPDMMTCTANVVAAVKHDSQIKLDLYVSLTTGTRSEDWLKREIRSKYMGLDFFSHIYIDKVNNTGADMGAFLTQMTRMEREGVSYDAILKMHTKTDPIWRERLVESLCGTPEQVRSILTKLDEQAIRGQPTLVAPLGTAFGPSSSVRDVFPHIVEKYQLTTTRPAFSPQHIGTMNILRRLLNKGQSMPFQEDDLRIVAGSAFWITGDALQPSMWAKADEDISPLLTKGYVEDQGMEHAMERVIPSLVVERGGRFWMFNLPQKCSPSTFLSTTQSQKMTASGEKASQNGRCFARWRW
jgi:lipopolysaccharide biosynthesis protein